MKFSTEKVTFSCGVNKTNFIPVIISLEEDVWESYKIAVSSLLDKPAPYKADAARMVEIVKESLSVY